MPDLMRIGGVSGWLRAAPIAAAAGIQVSTHLYPEVASHLMRITETAHWLEWQDWANPILKRPFPVKGSCLEIPNLPGVGIEWDEGGKSLSHLSYRAGLAPADRASFAWRLPSFDHLVGAGAGNRDRQRLARSGSRQAKGPRKKPRRSGAR
jgi:hypothetical protein